jgi:hypothetical protein
MSFTPVSSLLGGVLIGLASGLLWLASGQIAGISGIVGGLLPGWGQGTSWRVSFVAGMLVTAIALQSVWPGAFALAGLPNLGVMALGGLLVGVGTALGNGCTSGHGVCGIGRGSARSLVATLIFVLTGGLTVWGMNQLSGRWG